MVVETVVAMVDEVVEVSAPLVAPLVADVVALVDEGPTLKSVSSVNSAARMLWFDAVVHRHLGEEQVGLQRNYLIWCGYQLVY